MGAEALGACTTALLFCGSYGSILVHGNKRFRLPSAPALDSCARLPSRGRAFLQTRVRPAVGPDAMPEAAGPRSPAADLEPWLPGKILPPESRSLCLSIAAVLLLWWTHSVHPRCVSSTTAKGSWRGRPGQHGVQHAKHRELCNGGPHSGPCPM